MHQQRKGFWRFSCLFFGLIAFLKGHRAPGMWALTQLQITYRDGFVKRGLLGELLLLAHIRTKHAVDLFCLLELAALLSLLACFTLQSGLLAEGAEPLVVLAFAGSYAITLLAHLIGYQDITLFLLALLVVLIRSPHLRLLAALPLSIAALLIHEHFLLSALPALLFSFLADRPRPGARPSVLAPTLLVGVCLLTTVAIALRPSLDRQALAAFVHDTQAAAPYTIDPSILGILGNSTAANLRENASIVQHAWYWRADFATALCTLGPLLALLLYSGWPLARGWQRTAFLACSLAPLLLNILGWDVVRWFALCALTSFLNLGLLHRASAAVPSPAIRPLRLREQQAALLVLGIGLSSGHGLLDRQTINPFPFFPRTLRIAIDRHDAALHHSPPPLASPNPPPPARP